MNITVTLIPQMIAFILLIWFVNKVLWGPLSQMMEARQKRIADGLAAAEKGKHEQELAEQRAKENEHAVSTPRKHWPLRIAALPRGDDLQ